MSEDVKGRIADKLRAAFTTEEMERYAHLREMIGRGAVFSAERFRELLGASGYSKMKFGKEIGVADVTVGSWAFGHTRPLTEYIVKAAELLRCSVDDLMVMEAVPEDSVPEAVPDVGADTAQDAVEAEGMVYGTDPVPGDLSPEELKKIQDAAEAAEDAAEALSETGDTAADAADAVFAFAEESREGKPDYLRNIITLLERQRQKGIDKYGQALEDNHALSPMERFEYMKEEMADMLFYTEHLQRMYREGGTGADDYQRQTVKTSGMNESELLIRGVLMLSGAAGELAGSMDDMLFRAGAEADREAIAGRLSQIARGLAFAAEGIGMTLSEVMGNG